MILASTKRRGDPLVGAPTGAWSATVMPTYDGSGVAVHPTVVDMGRQWHGYRWWMGNTPFPSDNERLENPCIWGSNDRVEWEVPAGLVNPVATAPPAPAYNSDTELVFDPENQRMVLYWRTSGSGPVVVKASTSTNGNSWTPPQVLTLTGGTAGVSPAVIRRGPGDWHMWLFTQSSTIEHWVSTDPLGPWTKQANGTFTGGLTGGWHGDVIEFEGRLIGVVSSTNGRLIWTMTSDDGGDTWATGDASTGVVAYRPTILPSTVAGHVDVWVGTLKPYYRLWPRSMWPGID